MPVEQCLLMNLNTQDKTSFIHISIMQFSLILVLAAAVNTAPVLVPAPASLLDSSLDSIFTASNKEELENSKPFQQIPRTVSMDQSYEDEYDDSPPGLVEEISKSELKLPDLHADEENWDEQLYDPLKYVPALLAVNSSDEPQQDDISDSIMEEDDADVGWPNDKSSEQMDRDIQDWYDEEVPEDNEDSAKDEFVLDEVAAADWLKEYYTVPASLAVQSPIAHYQELLDLLKTVASTIESFLSNPLIDQETAERVFKESLETLQSSKVLDATSGLSDELTIQLKKYWAGVLNNLKRKNQDDRAMLSSMDESSFLGASGGHLDDYFIEKFDDGDAMDE
jgi:hypothetical protein